MVGADAALPDAAERQMEVGKMPVGIVDAAAAEAQSFDPGALQRGIGRKKIKSQRIGMGADEGKGLFGRRVGKYR